MTVREKTCLLFAILVVAVVLSHLNGILLATTKYITGFTCPVCDSRFEGHAVASTNTFGGQDRDFFKRAVGWQGILLFPKTCPVCFYSGYKSDFESNADISRTVREQVLSGRVLKPMVRIDKAARAYDIPAYVRYDLIAQTYQLRGKTDEVIAQQFLSASWATRAESDLPVTILGEELVRQVREWQKSQRNRQEAIKQDNWALYHIQKGKQYAEAAESVDGEARMIAVLAAVDTLRQYGETTEAQKVLPVLKTIMPDKQYSEFERFVNDSIARERFFQSKALPLFEKVIQTEEDSRQKASLTYLCAELHRRLENWDKAVLYYDQCLAIEGRPEWLVKWVNEQKDLLSK